MTTIDREAWQDVVSTFTAFFGGLGTISASDDAVSFSGAPQVDTGLELRRDGTSASFMPLHDLQTAWDQVTFDEAGKEIVLSAGGVSYRYRVPPRLLG